MVNSSERGRVVEDVRCMGYRSPGDCVNKKDLPFALGPNISPGLSGVIGGVCGGKIRKSRGDGLVESVVDSTNRVTHRTVHAVNCVCVYVW